VRVCLTLTAWLELWIILNGHQLGTGRWLLFGMYLVGAAIFGVDALRGPPEAAARRRWDPESRTGRSRLQAGLHVRGPRATGHRIIDSLRRQPATATT